VGCGAQATFASQKSEANFPQATFDDRSGCDFQPSDHISRRYRFTKNFRKNGALWAQAQKKIVR
jgi:hypothetical protein